MAQVARREALTWVDVDLRAIAHNVQALKRATNNLPSMAVVKANAYGHGLVPVAKAALAAGSDSLAVVSIEEALDLRSAGIMAPILVLAYVSPSIPDERVKKAIQKKIDLALFDLEMAKKLNRLATQRSRARVHIKIDTGTSRIGVLPQDARSFAMKVAKMPHLTAVGAFTHYARSEELDHPETARQTKRFRQALEAIMPILPSIQVQHAACSASMIGHPDTHFSAGRQGISLYGLWPSEDLRKAFEPRIRLKPALSWHTTAIQVRKLPKGAKISYGGTYTTKRPTTMAVLACGYADGLPRSASNAGSVLINGRRAPILGRVCMNLTMVDVTGIPRVKAGSIATIIGSSRGMHASAEDVAGPDTINYEIVTRINWNLPRYYTA